MFSFEISARSVLDVISENKKLVHFYSYLERTDLKRVLEKKLPWNWTILHQVIKLSKRIRKISKKKFLKMSFIAKIF